MRGVRFCTRASSKGYFMSIESKKLTSGEALNLLIEGNTRFTTGLRSVESLLSVAKMRELVERGQSPFAVILTCSDSRVPTEIIFDRGVGDLFVIRVAGNVTSPMVIASVEYAASVLGSPLVVVMGHSHCGAVTTAIRAEDDPNVAASLSPDLNVLISAIRPSVRETRRLLGPSYDQERTLHETTWTNVRNSVAQISERSKIMRELSEQGSVKVVGALCDLVSGTVTFDDNVVTTHANEKPKLKDARFFSNRRRSSIVQMNPAKSAGEER